MDNKDSNSVIREEVEAIISDIVALYEKSGKKVSGNFQTALEAKYGDNRAELFGVGYLAGRKSGKQPPVQTIEKWIIKRGIKPLEQNIKISSLAWAIAKSIAKKGTDEARHLKIYEQVITPERINQVINKVSEFNVNYFISEITTSLELLQKNI